MGEEGGREEVKVGRGSKREERGGGDGGIKAGREAKLALQ